MASALKFDRASLIAAFALIGDAAVANGTRLELCVYGGSALMLASNFRFATEDVDIAELERPRPLWFDEAVSAIAQQNDWPDDWINDAVAFHLSPLASRAADHIEFGSYPPTGETGLIIVVPTAEYLLALKLKAIRILDPLKGVQEADDIRNLMRVLGVDDDGAILILDKYFPKTARDSGKQRFLLKHLRSMPPGSSTHAPAYDR